MAVSEFDVFICHPHTHKRWVKSLASRLVDEAGLSVWLDQWEIPPGERFQVPMAQGIERAGCCVVCIGPEPPDAWVLEELMLALEHAQHEASYRVIPVMMPDGAVESIVGFLKTRSWVDFREETDEAFHRLVSGIRKQRPGRFSPDLDALLEKKRRELQILASLPEIDPGLRLKEQRRLIREALAHA